MFNKRRFIKNCLYLIEGEEKKMRLSEVEEKINRLGIETTEDDKVSVANGYMKKLLGDDDPPTPAIDKVAALSTIFNVPIDLLINGDLTRITSSERKIISFFSKLYSQTEAFTYLWNKEKLDNKDYYEKGELGNYEIKPTEKWNEENKQVETFLRFLRKVDIHNPSEEEEYLLNGEYDRYFPNSNYITTTIFSTPSCFEKDISFNVVNMKKTRVCSVYSVELYGGQDLFLLRDDEKDFPRYELYIVDTEVRPVCSAYRTESPLYSSFNNLYNLVVENATHIMLNEKTSSIIEKFLSDNNKEDYTSHILEKDNNSGNSTQGDTNE